MPVYLINFRPDPDLPSAYKNALNALTEQYGHVHPIGAAKSAHGSYCLRATTNKAFADWMRGPNEYFEEYNA